MEIQKTCDSSGGVKAEARRRPHHSETSSDGKDGQDLYRCKGTEITSVGCQSGALAFERSSVCEALTAGYVHGPRTLLLDLPRLADGLHASPGGSLALADRFLDLPLAPELGPAGLRPADDTVDTGDLRAVTFGFHQQQASTLRDASRGLGLLPVDWPVFHTSTIDQHPYQLDRGSRSRGAQGIGDRML